MPSPYEGVFPWQIRIFYETDMWYQLYQLATNFANLPSSVRINIKLCRSCLNLQATEGQANEKQDPIVTVSFENRKMRFFLPARRSWNFQQVVSGFASEQISLAAYILNKGMFNSRKEASLLAGQPLPFCYWGSWSWAYLAGASLPSLPRNAQIPMLSFPSRAQTLSRRLRQSIVRALSRCSLRVSQFWLKTLRSVNMVTREVLSPSTTNFTCLAELKIFSLLFIMLCIFSSLCWNCSALNLLMVILPSSWQCPSRHSSRLQMKGSAQSLNQHLYLNLRPWSGQNSFLKVLTLSPASTGQILTLIFYQKGKLLTPISHKRIYI